MKLSDLLDGALCEQTRGDPAAEVRGICHDSRLYKPGCVFVAIRGNQFDGHMFVAKACAQGAPAVVIEDERVVPLRYEGAVIKTKNSRAVLDVMAARFYGRPSENMAIVGCTGTNGKTTTTYLIEKILGGGQIDTAVIGTIDAHFRNMHFPASHTTPDALDLQSLLSAFHGAGAKAVAMEVSSHALALARVDSIQFDVALFTNLTRDHLDFHKSMEEYMKAKARLFQVLLKKSIKKNKRAIICADDPHGEQITTESVPNWTFGVEQGDFKATSVKMAFDGTHFMVESPVGSFEAYSPLIGLHNVRNALGALAVGAHLGVSKDAMVKALSQVHFVPGRLQRVSMSSPVHVFVDYAHTDDALRQVLSFLQTIRDQANQKSRIITVFGCGGDRDKGKRPMMMQVAQHFSDLVIVTSDNPRTENPRHIIDDVLRGADPKSDTFVVEEDREVAIQLALRKASPGDVVLIAGKGHENYQIIGTQRHPFDDAQIARDLLEK